jgi:uncharacterized protein YndB with AHSA1/START domain
MIEPIKKSVVAACAPDKAFDIFVNRIDGWWPKDSHSIAASRSTGDKPKVTFECRAGGRIYEVGSDGQIHQWGRVLEFVIGQKLIFSWHVGRPENEASEVEIRFSSAGDKGTLVELEHRNWDCFGDKAQAVRNEYDGGWQFVLGKCFAKAASQTGEPALELGAS